MPAVRLNQRSGALPKPGSAFQLRFFSDSLPPFSVFACSAVQSFGPLNVCCPNASSLVARFKPLSAGAGSKHGDLCNEQIRDSNERSHLSCGFFTQAPLKTRAVAAKKFICGLAVQSVASLLLKAGSSLSDYLVEYIIKPSFSGVVCPVDKRHKSIAKRRAA